MHALYGVHTDGVRGGVNFAGHAARRTELCVECHGKMRQRNADFTEQCKQARLRECGHAALKSLHGRPSPTAALANKESAVSSQILIVV